MTERIDFEVVTTILIDQNGDIIGQLRDDKPGINAPGMVAGFGGFMEPGETPKQAALRELSEETNVKPTEDQVQPFATTITGSDKRYLQNIFIAKGIDTKDLEVYEGQGAYIVRDQNDPKLTKVMKFAAEKWFAERDAILHADASQQHIHRYAATFFVGPDGTLYGQLRDNKPGIDQPGKIGGFGGACEQGETPLQAAVRELREETDLSVTPEQLEPYAHYVVWRPLSQEYEQANIYLMRNVDVRNIRVFEGQGTAPLLKPDDRVSVAVMPAVREWFAA